VVGLSGPKGYLNHFISQCPMYTTEQKGGFYVGIICTKIRD